jgi:hypothetical protein
MLTHSHNLSPTPKAITFDALGTLVQIAEEALADEKDGAV